MTPSLTTKTSDMPSATYQQQEQGGKRRKRWEFSLRLPFEPCSHCATCVASLPGPQATTRGG
ncbi:hypothetical protein DUNSADRAFT_13544 [Dunaliella salina]|uniref:Encoded protein n=1 Tax=Dunaliella salina TaxID=3046 RepID=A0ABQ7FRI4_DUNSA|nr:hypothetical protein DUNSADRAFT_13544 [Dunaliella salina]|eukprot:KAF5825213.1 hypothetical protein DUNSADRAFT_13544 [Dunaliella salina]